MLQRFNHEYFGPGDDPGGNMNAADDGDYILVEDLLALAEPWLDDTVPLGNAETALYRALEALRDRR